MQSLPFDAACVLARVGAGDNSVLLTESRSTNEGTRAIAPPARTTPNTMRDAQVATRICRYKLSLSFMRSLTSRVGRSGFADLPDYASCKGDIASPPGRDHGACSFVTNQQVWVQQIFGGRPDSKRGLSRSFTSSKLQFLRFYSYLTCLACF